MEWPSLHLKADCKERLASDYGNHTENGKNVHVQFNQLLQALAVPPSFTVFRVNTLASCSTEEIKVQLEDEINKQYASRGQHRAVVESHDTLPDVLYVKNSGPHLNLKNSAKAVIVGLQCGMSVLRGSDVFAQGIMGAPADMQSGDLVSVYADIEGACKKGLKDDFEERKLFVGNGIARISRHSLFKSETPAKGVGIEMTSPVYVAPSLSDILPSVVFPQNLPSVICSHVLDPQPNDCVLDMCAAPGGKTTHIATLMRDQGLVIAFDKGQGRVERIQSNASKWNLKSVRAFPYDATKSCAIDADGDPFPPFPPEYFDRVLLDAPCSGLGQRPSVFNKMSAREHSSYPPLQRKLLAQAVRLLKVGGVLVFSTCTVTHGENERQVEWLLREYPCVKLAKQDPHLGGTGAHFPDSQLSEENLKLLQRFDPGDLDPLSVRTVNNDCIGFFIAKFVKTESVR